MSTEIIETSDALGEPLELYRFSYGPGFGITLAYTDGDFPVTHDSIIYSPVAGLDRDAVNASQTLDKSELEITIAEDSDIAQMFLVHPPSDVVGLTIFRCHWDPSVQAITTPMAVWVGRILSCGREGYEAKLRGEPAVTSLRRVGLRRHYQYMCPHVLYGAACGVDRVTHSTATSIAAFDARSVTVPGLVSDQHLGGMVSWQPLGEPVERRTILKVARNTGLGTTVLTLAGAPNGMEVGMAAELARGCQHTIADCRDVFANAPNFGGMPYIPVQNPHGSSRIYN